MPNIPQGFKSESQVKGQFPERLDERGADDHDRGSAYISPWERLSAATERVMGATGRSRDEVRTDICRAIGDGAIKIQGKLGRHTTRPYIFNTVLVGEDFHIPSEIKPEDLDWERSRPVTAWYVRRERSRVPGYWELEWIELFRSDVTNALCAVRKRTDTTQNASSGTSASATSRSRPTLERARRAIQELYPQGVPGQAAEPNAILCRRVGEKLKKEKLPDVSNDTILRAAGRRK